MKYLVHRGQRQTKFTNFLAFFYPRLPWLTAVLDKIYDIYSVMLEFQEPSTVNVVCE